MLARLQSLFARTPFDSSLYKSAAMSTSASSKSSTAIFASGCFWGVEHIFLKHYPPAEGRGVIKTTVGYTGGKSDATNPDYRTVCSGATQHAEAVRIKYDEDKVGYAELVEFFYRTHDPTTLNAQGADTGTQYRSAIFTTTPVQAEIARSVTERIQAERFTPRGKSIVTEIKEAGQWWDAEEYHQLYLFKNPSGYQCPTHRLHW